MQTGAVLTVSESKRLIAKGVAAHPAVQRALKSGLVAIAKGTTNSYVVEEILGKPIEKTNYCTGTTWPTKGSRAGKVSGAIPDVVLRNGQPVEGATATGSVADMKAGDVFIKGANAVNHALKQAGLLIGHPTGGTLGATLGTLVARRIHLIIPVGLEKSVPGDIVELSRVLGRNDERVGTEPTLWPMFGDLVTEIEAIKLLTGADAVCVAAGGIGGAEGSVRLTITGDKGQIDAVVRLLDSVYGEPAFVR
ncbi:MAG: hypothetical protein FJ279_26820 [Planctomycetes bacterium]|nr:hypothetical protein [Planctomycetota bacterium]MBM4087495.1 hypothetical protein [Planctomycetota bacterium]